jgi:hypothetical protein
MNPSLNHTNKPLQCGSTGQHSFLQGFSLRAVLLTMLRQVSVPPVIRAGRVALAELVANDRHLAGLGFGMVGVFSIFIHLLFDEAARDHSWYYLNWFYFMYTVRGYLFLVCFALAIELILPQKFKLSTLLTVPMLMVGLCGTIYCYSATTNEELLKFEGFYLSAVIIGSLIGALLYNIPYLCYRKYHLKDGNIARIIGVIKMPNVDPATKMKILENLIEESENYNNRI